MGRFQSINPNIPRVDTSLTSYIILYYSNNHILAVSSFYNHLTSGSAGGQVIRTFMVFAEVTSPF